MAKSVLSTRQILRRKQVEMCTGLSRSTIYQWILEGRFPAPIPLGNRAVGWDSLEIERWIEEQIARKATGGMPMSHDISQISSETCPPALLKTLLDIGGSVCKCQFPEDGKLFHSKWADQFCDFRFAQVIPQDALQSASIHNGCLIVAIFTSSSGRKSINKTAAVTVRSFDDIEKKSGDDCDGLSSQI